MWSPPTYAGSRWVTVPDGEVFDREAPAAADIQEVGLHLSGNGKEGGGF